MTGNQAIAAVRAFLSPSKDLLRIYDATQTIKQAAAEIEFSVLRNTLEHRRAWEEYPNSKASQPSQASQASRLGLFSSGLRPAELSKDFSLQ
jgi:hypothetical protein